VRSTCRQAAQRPRVCPQLRLTGALECGGWGSSLRCEPPFLPLVSSLSVVGCIQYNGTAYHPGWWTGSIYMLSSVTPGQWCVVDPQNHRLPPSMWQMAFLRLPSSFTRAGRFYPLLVCRLMYCNLYVRCWPFQHNLKLCPVSCTQRGVHGVCV
jgi:hypothetical protein